MYTTKATFILGALLSAGTLLAQAPDSNQAPPANAPQVTQSQPGRPHRTMDPAKQAAHLGKRLGLSSDQVAQITPIFTDRQQQMHSLRADSSLTERDRHTKARAILQDSKSKIEAVMNDTQKQQFEQMLADRRSHHNHNREPQA
jgi:Spy/CpxP family protein refolding chaperone